MHLGDGRAHATVEAGVREGAHDGQVGLNQQALGDHRRQGLPVLGAQVALALRHDLRAGRPAISAFKEFLSQGNYHHKTLL